MSGDWSDYVSMEDLRFKGRIFDIENEDEKYVDVE